VCECMYCHWFPCIFGIGGRSAVKLLASNEMFSSLLLGSQYQTKLRKCSFVLW
jgi:hypothetical protein